MRRESFNGFVRARRVLREDKVGGLVYYVAIPLALATRMDLRAGQAIKVELEV